MEDTIAAISTAIGEGGIAIIRVSGPRAFDVADRVFHARDGRATEFPSHTLHFGIVRDNEHILDHVMLAVMRAPRTYTKEDTVEINCHGGVLTARKVLALCLKSGARLAEPGEFTKRAFLNGRLDLTQAEAVMDLIHARSDRAHTAAMHELEGHLSARIDAARDRLLTILAHVEAHIDFPDEDLGMEVRDDLVRDISKIVDDLRPILATAREGKMLREGISVAIIGRPNVGKSSLLNALLGHDRAIVTPIPGTTRDTIEETVVISGIPFRFADTAGIRKTQRTTEALGVNRSRKALESSEIVIHVLDASKPSSPADRDIMLRCDGKQTLVALNKADLPHRLNPSKNAKAARALYVSALTGLGLDELRGALVEVAYSGSVGMANIDVAINERQADLLHTAIDYLTNAQHEMASHKQIEIPAQELRRSLNALGEIVGKTSTEDILDRIFSTFCIGK